MKAVTLFLLQISPCFSHHVCMWERLMTMNKLLWATTKGLSVQSVLGAIIVCFKSVSCNFVHSYVSSGECCSPVTIYALETVLFPVSPAFLFTFFISFEWWLLEWCWLLCALSLSFYAKCASTEAVWSMFFGRSLALLPLFKESIHWQTDWNRSLDAMHSLRTLPIPRIACDKHAHCKWYRALRHEHSRRSNTLPSPYQVWGAAWPRLICEMCTKVTHPAGFALHCYVGRQSN